MEESNKIDLKSVNKSKKSFKLPKLKNPFKKQDSIKRDEEGKFATTSGSGGLSVAKKINWKRATPLIVILVLLGGGLVFKSFAGGSQQTVASWYRTCLNREPDGGGLAYWSGRLDKGEATWTVAQAFMSASGKSSCSYPDVAKTGSSPADPAKATPATPATTATASSTAVNDSKAWVTLSNAHVTNAKNENAKTYQISLKNPVSKSDLNVIASKEGYVRGAISQLQTGVGKLSSSYNQTLSNSATKSQAPSILANLRALQANILNLNNYLSNITNDYKRAESTYKANISFFAKVTETQRKQSDCKKAGGTPTWTGGCNIPPASSTSNPVLPNCPSNITSSSSSTCIKMLQSMLKNSGYYYGAIDGKWGSNTTNAVYNWQNNLRASDGSPTYVTPVHMNCKGSRSAPIVVSKDGSYNAYGYYCATGGFNAIDCPSAYRHTSQIIYGKTVHVCKIK